ncbi:hypothetical protein BDF21DRAFT_413377 [Thamnidium elegans]|nr:hypothetical protein BDF21DRAFT_413377 [Thamnidium elegans]
MDDNSTESVDKSCLLVSTLIKVTEHFLQSVNLLKNDIGSDPNTHQQQLLSVMEHYDRLNMVMKVLKIAYPIKINTPNENNVVNTVMKNVTTTVSNTLSKMNEIPAKPELNNNNIAAAAVVRPVLAEPRPQQQPVHTKPKPTTTTPTVTHTETRSAASTQVPRSTVVEPVQVEVSQPPKPLVKADNLQIKKPESTRPKPKETSTKTNNISSSVFLDQFEKTAHEFAAQHNIAMEQIWESLLVHALPKDKLAWAEKTILYKNLDWNTARQYYLTDYPDVIQLSQKPVKKVFRENPSAMPKLLKTSTLSRINLPSHIPSTTNTNAQIRERQSRYAEYLLSIEMKEYDSITEFNAKFYRYASIACMNLNDGSLSRRYVSSLLAKYRLPVEHVIQQNSPQNLKETMDLASSVIIPQTQ